MLYDALMKVSAGTNIVPVNAAASDHEGWGTMTVPIGDDHTVGTLLRHTPPQLRNQRSY